MQTLRRPHCRPHWVLLTSAPRRFSLHAFLAMVLTHCHRAQGTHVFSNVGGMSKINTNGLKFKSVLCDFTPSCC